MSICQDRLEDLSGRLQHAVPEDEPDVADLSDAESMPSLVDVEEFEPAVVNGTHNAPEKVDHMSTSINYDLD